MKQLLHFTFALLLGAMVATGAFAQKGGGNPGGPTAGGPDHFGLSDSCWKVFLSGLSSGDAAKLTADQTTISTNQTQIGALEHQEDSLLRNSKGKDTSIRSKLKALDGQIRTLNDANNTAQMDIGTILKANGTLLQTVAENCGRPKRDTGDHGRDSTKGGNNGPGDRGFNTKGHFGLSDSCWAVFTSEISAANASSLTADVNTIKANAAQIDSLMKLIRSMKGAAKDSAGRAAIKAILAEINVLIKSSGTAEKNYASIIKSNDSLLQNIRQTCGRVAHHKGTAGGGSNGLTATAIVPNPAPANGTASITITLTESADVTIFISNAIAQGPPSKLIFNGMLPSGSTVETLDLKGFGTGAYLVTIQSGNTSLMQKLIIQ